MPPTKLIRQKLNELKLISSQTSHTSYKKQSRWELLQENNPLSLEPPSKQDQHSPWSNASPEYQSKPNINPTYWNNTYKLQFKILGIFVGKQSILSFNIENIGTSHKANEKSKQIKKTHFKFYQLKTDINMTYWLYPNQHLIPPPKLETINK